MNGNTDLQAMTERLSTELFGKPYLGQARLNPRLRTSAGRFLGGAEVIEVNTAYIDAHNEVGLVDTLKHELIHYHYPKAGHGPVFRREAARIGCSRFCAPLPGSTPRLRYLCQSCDMSICASAGSMCESIRAANAKASYAGVKTLRSFA